jgi:thiol-disulfide isomerase/thioredoxin
MVLTPSTMLPLGTIAPDFELPDVVSGQRISPDTLVSAGSPRPLLVMFICEHCPYVKHVQGALADLGRDWGDRVAIVAISANDAATHPTDGPEGLRAMAEAEGFTFPLCYDETQAIAKAYTAACTPDFFLFDGDRRLTYRGQLDDSRPGNSKPVTGRDLRTAIAATVAGEPVPEPQIPSIGCNIKWKPGNAPGYFGA